MDADYYPRRLTVAVQAALADTPVVCLLGPRQCGKSTLAKHLEPDRFYLTFDDEDYLKSATQDPDGFIDRLPLRVILDEIQLVPSLLRSIKRSVDRDRRPGRFLLTGSANLLLLPQTSESLAGRMETIYLQPLSDAEKHRAPGQFLARFLNRQLDEPMELREDGPLPDIADRLMRGGFPEPLTRDCDRARQWHRQYVKSIIERDVRDIARIRDGRELARLVELLALRTGTLLNAAGLSKDLGIHRETIDHYLAILERLFLLRQVPSWHRNEAKRLIKAPKLHMVDHGLAATLANLTAGDWLKRREDMGRLLESFVVQQIHAQAGWTDPDLRMWHYRDKDQVEVDVVVTRGTDTWGIEVKASRSVSKADVKGLDRLAAQCGTDFKGGCVLYDGRVVLPIGGTPYLAVPLKKLWEQ